MHLRRQRAEGQKAEIPVTCWCSHKREVWNEESRNRHGGCVSDLPNLIHHDDEEAKGCK